VSDRVAIIGGKTPGRDHFPHPATAPSTTIAAGYPYLQPRVSLAQMCKLFYRVKRWSITWTASGVVHGTISMQVQDYVWRNSTGVDPANPSQAVLATRESDLIVGNTARRINLWFENRPTGYAPFSTPPIASDVSGHVSGYGSGGWPHGLTQHSLEVSYANPRYVGGPAPFAFGLNAGGLLSGPSYSIQYSVDTTGMASPVSVGGVTVDGIAVATLYRAGSKTDLGSMQVAIAIAEYWPYATKAGLPVYDTATGAQLRDPLS
jgi:hypothetical protein